jgi:hypothetical protein
MDPTVQIRQLLREEKINSQDAKMTLFLQQGWINLEYKMGRRSDSL